MNNSISMNHLNPCVCNNSYYDDAGIKYCCMGVKPYCCRDLCNQCGNHFCCCNCCYGPVAPTGSIPPIQPTGSMPPIQPLPPVQPLPPIPPIPPPVPVGNFAQFEAPTQVRNNGQFYRFNLINIQGDPVQFDQGTGVITLKPNITYRYAWKTETLLQGAVPADIENILVSNRVGIQGTRGVANNIQPGVLTVLESNGQFVSEPDQATTLRLGFITVPNVQGETSATLTIEEVQP